MQTLIRKWFTPKHVCKYFMYFYGLGIQRCEECGKEYPLYDIEIKHQR
jgi:hypothetical protein